MPDLVSTLPEEVEIGAVRRFDRRTQVVEQDSGFEVRNNRWSDGLRVYEISFPTARRDDPVYLAVKALYEEAEGQLYSFSFTDWTDESTVTVRFASELEIQSPAGLLDHIVSMVLKEVREEAEA